MELLHKPTFIENEKLYLCPATKSKKIEAAIGVCARAISMAEVTKKAALAPWIVQASSAQSQLNSTSMYITTYVASLSHSHGHGFAHGHSYRSHGDFSNSSTVSSTPNPAYSMAEGALRSAEQALRKRQKIS